MHVQYFIYASSAVNLLKVHKTKLFILLHIALHSPIVKFIQDAGLSLMLQLYGNLQPLNKLCVLDIVKAKIHWYVYGK